MEKVKPYLLKLKDFCSKKYILGLIGAIVTIIALFLPFAKVTVSLLGITQSVSVKFIEGDGVIVLILTIIAIIMLFADLIASKLNGGVANFFKKITNPKLILIPTIISAIILIVDSSNFESVTAQYGSFAVIEAGAGIVFMWIGLILTAVYSVMAKKAE